MNQSIYGMAVKDAMAVEELIKVASRAENRLSYVNTYGSIRSGNKIDADLVIDLRRAIASAKGETP